MICTFCSAAGRQFPSCAISPVNGSLLLQVAGYAGLLLSTPTILYEIISYVVPGLTVSEKRLLAPVMFGSSILFFLGCETVLATSLMPACAVSQHAHHASSGFLCLMLIISHVTQDPVCLRDPDTSSIELLRGVLQWRSRVAVVH